MSCKFDAGSNNSYSFTGSNVHSTSIYLRKHWLILYKYPLIYSNSYTCIHNISDMQNIHRQKKTFNKDNLNDNYNHNV